MPDLMSSLQGRDLGHLRIVADLWSVELDAPDARIGLSRLAAALLEAKRVKTMIGSLPQAARQALDELYQNEGRLPWALFSRRYGQVAEIGPARRDREQPYRKPTSPAETLWYRALVARAFLDSPSGPEEYAYIPDDMLALLPDAGMVVAAPLGRPATPAERAYPVPVSDQILDQACTLLAGLRLGVPLENDLFPAGKDPMPVTADALTALLAAAGLIDRDGMPLPEPAREFLEASSGAALVLLVKAWLASPDFNELRLMPGVKAEGEWTNDPLRARQSVLDFLHTLPGAPGRGKERPFWHLGAFCAAVHQAYPDFQRPAGDYDSWYLRDTATGEFLRGFAHWDAVEGALLRYIIAGPMHWLGLVDLACPEPGAPASAFRFSALAADLLRGEAPARPDVEPARVQVRSDGRLRVPRLAPRLARYQIARFTVWEGDEAGEHFRYRVTPSSLERARGQGLRAGQLLGLLRRYAANVPPSLAHALERWEERGSEAHLEQVIVLRLGSSELLQTLRSSRAGRFLGEPLGPTSVIVKPGAWEKVAAALAELGYLVEEPQLQGLKGSPE